MGKKKDNTSMNRHSLISSSPKTSNNSYDMSTTNDAFFYNEDESKYLFCGIVCTKTFLIIFNFLYLVMILLRWIWLILCALFLYHFYLLIFQRFLAFYLFCSDCGLFTTSRTMLAYFPRFCIKHRRMFWWQRARWLWSRRSLGSLVHGLNPSVWSSW